MIAKLFLGACLLVVVSGSQVKAEINDFHELKRKMELPGEASIYLNHNIAVSEAIYVKGKKRLMGNGYVIQRGEKNGDVYKGTILVVKNAELELENITLSGTNEAGSEIMDCWGRLVDVKQGKVVLGTKSILIKNQNKNGNSNGGGAVLVENDGTLLVKDAWIKYNRNVVGGAGIRVEQGGNVNITGGVIANNDVKGIGDVEGFDGRGGAIYNCGKVQISGGQIRENTVTGFVCGDVRYGGVGGALYNQGECRILGGTIKGNQASFGGGAIYTTQGSLLKITGGTMKSNGAVRGENLYLAGGTWKIPQISGVYPKVEKAVIKETGKKREEKIEKQVTKIRKKETSPKVYQKKTTKENKKDKKVVIYREVHQEKKEEEVVPETGKIRFFAVNTKDNEEEECWYFSAGKIAEIKQYMRQQKNPFTRETNRTFIERFCVCCQKGGDCY